jgi:Iap family predicted aminopeptidase
MCVYDPEYKTNKEKKVEEFRKILEKNEIYSSVFIFYMKKGKLETITENNWRDLLKRPGAIEYSEMYCRFYLNRDYSFRRIRWEEINE